MNLKSIIREFKDFPKEGINFKDICPLLASAEAMSFVLNEFDNKFSDTNFDIIAGVESRGLIFASAFAVHSGKSCIMVRKKGKLPGITVQTEYDLEYGTGILEIQKDAVKAGQKVLIVDDLLATGGTALGAAKLIESVGGELAGMGFVIELEFLNGREKVSGYNVKTLVKYE